MTTWQKSTHSLTDSSCLEVGTDWVKSSYSGHDQCVEAQRPTAFTVKIRDSKNLTQAPLEFSGGSWDNFIQGVKNGDFGG